MFVGADLVAGTFAARQEACACESQANQKRDAAGFGNAAGAGVSAGRPSNSLPFEECAEALADGEGGVERHIYGDAVGGNAVIHAPAHWGGKSPITVGCRPVSSANVGTSTHESAGRLVM